MTWALPCVCWCVNFNTTCILLEHKKTPFKQGPAHPNLTDLVASHAVTEPPSDFGQVWGGKKRCPFFFLTTPPQSSLFQHKLRISPFLLIFKEQRIVLRSETKLEFPKAPSAPHIAAHPGLGQRLVWSQRPSGYSIQKGSVSKAACGGFSKQLSLVPIAAWPLSLHTSLKMFPLSLIDICTNLLRSWDQAGKSFSWGKKKKS